MVLWSGIGGLKSYVVCEAGQEVAQYFPALGQVGSLPAGHSSKLQEKASGIEANS